MSQNISGVSGTNSIKTSYTELSKNNKAEKTSEKTKATTEKVDENTYLDTELEDMSLEDVTELTCSLEGELLILQTEIENMEQMIDTNEEMRALYQKQCEELKAELKEMQKEIGNAETPQEKMQLNLKRSSLNRRIQSLSSNITSLLYEISSNTRIKNAMQSQYSDTNSNYIKAQSAQNSKQRALDAELRASNKNATNINLSDKTSVVQVSSSGSATSSSAASNNYSKAPSGVSTGKVSNNMLGALKGWEGLKTKAYKCPAGVWTIGYGHTGNVSPGQTISEAQAEQYLKQDLSSFENEVTSMANSAGVKLTQGQYDALVSFSYNCGGPTLKESGILQMLKAGHIDEAANKMKQYNKGGGRVLQGLVNRRAQEASWLYA